MYCLQMKKINILLFIICLLISLQTYSQEEFIRPPAKFITKFSFTQLTGGIVIVKGLLDDIPDSLNFILDTGSSGISLDSTTVEELHLFRQKSNFTVKGIGGIRNVDFTYNHTLHFPNLPVEKLDFHINDYELLSNIYGIRIDGIIGASFFKRYIVKIDYDHFIVEIFSIGYIKYPKGGYIVHPTFQSLPASKQHIKDLEEVEGNFIIDCGAGLNALLSQDFIDEHFNLAKDKKIFTTLNDGVGGKKRMNLTVIQSIQFGPYRFKKVPIYIFDDETNITDYPLYGGLIGNDIMRRFNVILNYADGVFYFKPNMHFIDRFDYSYIGFNLYVINGEIKVMDIITGSPGDKAGLKNEDILLGMETTAESLYEPNTAANSENDLKNNTNKVLVYDSKLNEIKNQSNRVYIGKDIQVYKNVLQNAGLTIKLFILRNKMPLEFKLKIRNILRRK